MPVRCVDCGGEGWSLMIYSGSYLRALWDWLKGVQ